MTETVKEGDNFGERQKEEEACESLSSLSTRCLQEETVADIRDGK